jgi:hypothetical protein
MTIEMHAKIELLDKLFGAMSIAQLKEFTESEQVVSRLRGDEANPNILRNLISDNEIRTLDVMTLRTDVLNLKEDLKQLIKSVFVLTATVPYSQELQNLKSKHGVY